MAELKAFSAPGKALIAGGYLVLDRQFGSYAVALSARMHAVVSGTPSATTSVTIKSPQFAEGEWEYSLKKNSYEVIEAKGRTNPFAAAAVSAVLAYAGPTTSSHKIIITIFSDSGYHSQDNSQLKSPHSQGSKSFHYHTQKITDVSKTGLGSSAGLVTVLTTALLSYLIPDLDINSSKGLQLVHNLSQTAHCQAQGKVGSGFDVAAAVFGSIVYRRFDPSLINSLKSVVGCSQEEYHKQIYELANSDWSIRNDRVALPRGVKLLMGDVKGGSNTPKLVAKVLSWRQSDPESKEIYDALDDANMKLVECLSKMNEFAINEPESYDSALTFIVKNPSSAIVSSNSPDLSLFQDLIKSVQTIRANFRIITERSGAEIEPPQQTELLDECQKLNGVIAGVVPGAGGYDAVSLIIAEAATDSIVEETKTNSHFDKVSWMNLREEAFGVRPENVEDYKGFL